MAPTQNALNCRTENRGNRNEFRVKAREAQEEASVEKKNCANNSLVYVQRPREATVQCGTIFRFFFAAKKKLAQCCQRMDEHNVSQIFLFVTILNKAPGEENLFDDNFFFIYFRH